MLGTTTDDGYLTVRVLKCDDCTLSEDLTLRLVYVGHRGRLGGWVTYVFLVDDDLLPLMEMARQTRTLCDVRMDALIPTEYIYKWERGPHDAPALEMYPEDHR